MGVEKSNEDVTSGLVGWVCDVQHVGRVLDLVGSNRQLAESIANVVKR